MSSLEALVALYEPVIDTMPGYITIHNLDSKMMLTNNTTAKAMGFNASLDVVGLRYFDMKCHAAEDHYQFENQDKLVFTQAKTIKFLSYHRYAEDWKLILGEKSPLRDEQAHLMGLISHWTDVTQYNLIDISRFIFSSITKFNKKNDKKFTYILEDGTSNRYGLSDRQLECLFFLIRGKSAKAIADILKLSPRTIESYINELKFKLGCVNKEQIIEKSFSEGLLSILPQSLFQLYCRR